jgi:hypothetical protein
MILLAGRLLLALVMPISPTDEDEWWQQQRKIYPITCI